MPATEFHGSFGRSVLSLRRDQVLSVDAKAGHEATSHEIQLESFQRQVADRFADLGSASSDELLSLSWIGKLLDAFLCCQEDFRAIIFNNQSQLMKPPTNRLIADYFERSVKALDLCNAVRDGIDQVKQLQKLIEIVICALDSSGGGSRQRFLGEGQFRRAKKALIDLAITMFEQKDSSGLRLAHRNRSFSRNNKDNHHHRHIGHRRSLSCSVSRSWSATKQLQAMGNNLAPPRVSDVIATNGLAVPIYTMASILLFVTWALVAAIPCQDRGLHVYFYIPRNFQWSEPIMSLHDRILEESKKRERKNACGLVKEVYQIEASSRLVSELVDSVHKFPLTEEKETEVKNRVQELVHVYDTLKEGLDPLVRQVREVFHRIVRIRAEGFDSLGKGS